MVKNTEGGIVMKLDYVSKMKKHLAIGLIMCLTVLSIAPNADAKQTKKPKKYICL